MITYVATLDVPGETLTRLTQLLRTHQLRIGTRRGRRAAGARGQALLVEMEEPPAKVKGALILPEALGETVSYLRLATDSWLIESVSNPVVNIIIGIVNQDNEVTSTYLFYQSSFDDYQGILREKPSDATDFAKKLFSFVRRWTLLSTGFRYGPSTWSEVKEGRLRRAQF